MKVDISLKKPNPVCEVICHFKVMDFFDNKNKNNLLIEFLLLECLKIHR